MEGVLIDPSVRTARFYLPWPGRYRITWGFAQFQIEERPGTFQGSGSSSFSPGDGMAFDIPAEGPAPRVTIPHR